MTLLILYLMLALGVSFLCSLTEAGLLSLPSTYAATLTRQGKRVGPILEKMKQRPDRPLAAILTLNTAAHTIGAAGVGAQSLIVFENVPVAITSAVLTLLILVLSEIIPKTIGTVYARPLAGPVVFLIRIMIVLTWPLMIVLDAFSRLLKSGVHSSGLSREQIAVIAEMGLTEGILREGESRIIQNMLRLSRTHVKDVMTPRTVAFMVQRDETLQQVAERPEFRQFSRIPVYGKSPDDLVGVALKAEVYEGLRQGKGETPVGDLVRSIHAVPELSTLTRVLEQFAESGHHLFHVVDEYGGTAGIVTLEDIFESMMGAEIIDETDLVADLQRLARRRGKRGRPPLPTSQKAPDGGAPRSAP
jgi:CBS domain containing-hemolysin-like protein